MHDKRCWAIVMTLLRNSEAWYKRKHAIYIRKEKKKKRKKQKQKKRTKEKKKKSLINFHSISIRFPFDFPTVSIKLFVPSLPPLVCPTGPIHNQGPVPNGGSRALLTLDLAPRSLFLNRNVVGLHLPRVAMLPPNRWIWARGTSHIRVLIGTRDGLERGPLQGRIPQIGRAHV